MLKIATFLQPRYIPGTIGCAICFGLEFFVIIAWRCVLVSRNRRRDRKLSEGGVSEEERSARGKELGQMDYTDIENPYREPCSLTSRFY